MDVGKLEATKAIADPVGTAQRGEPSVFGRFTRIRISVLARPAWLTGSRSPKVMTLAQEHKAFAELLCWLENDWVQLPAVVSFVNEATGFSPCDTVTEDARSFVTRLVREEEIVAGSVSASGFAPWAGNREEILERVLGLMPVGHSVGEEWSVWFDRPDKRRANPESSVSRSRHMTPVEQAPGRE